MKKQFLSIVCFPVFAAVAVAQQNNSLPVQMLRLDRTTAINKPGGKAETKEIGKEGGNTVSEDGKIESNDK